MPFDKAGEVSHRWYRTWERWDQDQWNKPSRSDNYLMLIALRLQHLLYKKNLNRFTMLMQKIPFVFKKPVAPPKLTEAEKIAAATAVARSQWDRRVGRE